MNSNAALVCSKAPAAFPLTSDRDDILLDWRGLEEMEMRLVVLKRNGMTVLDSKRLLMIMKTQPCDVAIDGAWRSWRGLRRFL
jgi:hypothetical protein